jgi:hypothetical protein
LEPGEFQAFVTGCFPVAGSYEAMKKRLIKHVKQKIIRLGINSPEWAES